MDRLAEFVIRRYRGLLVGVGLPALALIAFIPTMNFNDQWVEYFDDRIEFRVDSDEAMNHFGLYPIEFSIPAIGPGGISEPEYLANLETPDRLHARATARYARVFAVGHHEAPQPQHAR